MILTSCTPALDMLTLPLVSLSKPVGPIMSWQIIICQLPILFSKNYFVALSAIAVWAFPFFLVEPQKGRAIRFYSSAAFVLRGNRYYP